MFFVMVGSMLSVWAWLRRRSKSIFSLSGSCTFLFISFFIFAIWVDCFILTSSRWSILSSILSISLRSAWSVWFCIF